MARGRTPTRKGNQGHRAPYKSEVVDPDQLGRGGIRLRQHRMARLWTLDMAAEQTGVARSTIQAIEADKTGYSSETLEKLAKGFGVTVGELFDVDPREMAIEGQGEGLWSMVRRADKTQRQRIHDYASGVVGPKK